MQPSSQADPDILSRAAEVASNAPAAADDNQSLYSDYSYSDAGTGCRPAAPASEGGLSGAGGLDDDLYYTDSAAPSRASSFANPSPPRSARTGTEGPVCSASCSRDGERGLTGQSLCSGGFSERSAAVAGGVRPTSQRSSAWSASGDGREPDSNPGDKSDGPKPSAGSDSIYDEDSVDADGVYDEPSVSAPLRGSAFDTGNQGRGSKNTKAGIRSSAFGGRDTAGNETPCSGRSAGGDDSYYDDGYYDDRPAAKEGGAAKEDSARGEKARALPCCVRLYTSWLPRMPWHVLRAMGGPPHAASSCHSQRQ